MPPAPPRVRIIRAMSPSPLPGAPAPAAPALRWDLFCRVVDNFGDVGVCWRLACDLAGRGQRVRLWVDDAAALRWMAPAGRSAVEVIAWRASTPCPPPGDVVIEAFGCDPPPAFVATMAARAAPGAAGQPVWINLEYLSAEPYVERSHGLASPQMSGPGRGLAKWFFYPGYTAATGGLLREPTLAAELRAFDRAAWLASQGIPLRPGEQLVSLFCYPGAPVDRLVAALAADHAPTLLATAPGAATGATRAALAALAPAGPGRNAGPEIRQHALPWLSQPDFDRLLWAADLNFVRGEDSWVRAQWAGKPFVWQAYAQDDGAHVAKISAFLALALQGADAVAQRTLSAWHAAWNGLDGPRPEGENRHRIESAGAEPPPVALPEWTPENRCAVEQAVRAWRGRLIDSPDLVTRLLAFVREKR